MSLGVWVMLLCCGDGWVLNVHRPIVSFSVHDCTTSYWYCFILEHLFIWPFLFTLTKYCNYYSLLLPTLFTNFINFYLCPKRLLTRPWKVPLTFSVGKVLTYVFTASLLTSESMQWSNSCQTLTQTHSPVAIPPVKPRPLGMRDAVHRWMSA